MNDMLQCLKQSIYTVTHQIKLISLYSHLYENSISFSGWFVAFIDEPAVIPGMGPEDKVEAVASPTVAQIPGLDFDASEDRHRAYHKKVSLLYILLNLVMTDTIRIRKGILVLIYITIMLVKTDTVRIAQKCTHFKLLYWCCWWESLLVTGKVLPVWNYNDAGKYPHLLCHKRVCVLNYIDADDSRHLL